MGFGIGLGAFSKAFVDTYTMLEKADLDKRKQDAEDTAAKEKIKQFKMTELGKIEAEAVKYQNDNLTGLETLNKVTDSAKNVDEFVYAQNTYTDAVFSGINAIKSKTTVAKGLLKLTDEEYTNLVNGTSITTDRRYLVPLKGEDGSQFYSYYDVPLVQKIYQSLKDKDNAYKIDKDGYVLSQTIDGSYIKVDVAGNKLPEGAQASDAAKVSKFTTAGGDKPTEWTRVIIPSDNIQLRENLKAAGYDPDNINNGQLKDFYSKQGGSYFFTNPKTLEKDGKFISVKNKTEQDAAFAQGFKEVNKESSKTSPSDIDVQQYMAYKAGGGTLSMEAWKAREVKTGTDIGQAGGTINAKTYAMQTFGDKTKYDKNTAIATEAVLLQGATEPQKKIYKDLTDSINFETKMQTIFPRLNKAISEGQIKSGFLDTSLKIAKEYTPQDILEIFSTPKGIEDFRKQTGLTNELEALVVEYQVLKTGLSATQSQYDKYLDIFAGSGFKDEKARLALQKGFFNFIKNNNTELAKQAYKEGFVDTAGTYLGYGKGTASTQQQQPKKVKRNYQDYLNGGEY